MFFYFQLVFINDAKNKPGILKRAPNFHFMGSNGHSLAILSSKMTTLPEKQYSTSPVYCLLCQTQTARFEEIIIVIACERARLRC